MNIFFKWLLNTCSIMIASYLITGVFVESFWSALWVALFLGLINITLKPLLILVTLPINILTLGFFTFIINASLILLASTIIKGFYVSGFWAAIIFSIILSVISYILNKVLLPK